jgi:hypothetical protein
VNATTQDTPRRSWPRSVATFAALLVPSVLGVGSTLLFGVAETREGPDGPRMLLLWREFLWAVPAIAAVVTGVALFVWARWGRKSAPSRRSAGLANKLALLLTLVAYCGGRALGSWTDWGVTHAVTAPDGARYRLGFAWWSVAILRETEETWYGTRLRVEAVGRTDSPRRQAVVIRPRGAAEPAIWFTADGWLLETNGNRGRLAFDPRTGRELTMEDLAEVSPFALLGPNDTGTEEDLVRLEDALRELPPPQDIGPPGEIVAPREKLLLDALDSPNPWVRDAARRLVRAGGAELYPEATKRL